MCKNGYQWCMGHGYYDPSKVCRKCQSADSAHVGLAIPKPGPVRLPSIPELASNGEPPLLATTLSSGGLMRSITPPRARSPSRDVSPMRGLSNSSVNSIVTPSHALGLRDPSPPVNPFREEKTPEKTISSTSSSSTSSSSSSSEGSQTFVPDAVISGPIFRGEDPPLSGKPGRTPTRLVSDRGFAPWQIASAANALPALVKLCNGSATQDLQSVAYRWQKLKDRVNGFFVSTGRSKKDSYDNYRYRYSIHIPDLQLVPWNEAGFECSADAVKKCYLYSSTKPVTASSFLAVLCLVEKSRQYELLVLTPIGLERITLARGSDTVQMSNYKESPEDL